MNALLAFFGGSSFLSISLLPHAHALMLTGYTQGALGIFWLETFWHTDQKYNEKPQVCGEAWFSGNPSFAVAAAGTIGQTHGRHRARLF